jgi:hypothetical protein
VKRLWGNFRDLAWPSVATRRGQSIAIAAGLIAAFLMFWEAAANLIGRANIIITLLSTNSPLLKMSLEHTFYNTLYAVLILLFAFFLRRKRSRLAASGLCLLALYAPGGTWVLFNLNSQLMPGLRSPLRLALLGVVLLLTLHGLRGAWAWQRKGRFGDDAPVLETVPRSRSRVLALGFIALLAAFAVWNAFIFNPPATPDIRSQASFYEECLGRHLHIPPERSESTCRTEARNQHHNERWLKEGGYLASIRFRLEQAIALPVGLAIVVYWLIFGLPRSRSISVRME